MRREVREPGEACRHEDKHKAPASTPPRPLSLQNRGGRFVSFSFSVGTIHQDGGERFPVITAFGRHISLGAGEEWMEFQHQL